jgi:hypothetical protein
MQKLKQNLERHRDDANVQAGNRQHVRESGRSVAIANLRREIAHIRDEESFGERSIRDEHALDRGIRVSPPALAPSRAADDGEPRVVYDVAALRRREVAKDRYDAPGRSATGRDRKGHHHWACGWSGVYEGTWRRGLVESRGLDAFADKHLFTVRVRDDPSGRDKCTSRERGTAGEDQKTPVRQAPQHHGQTDETGEHRTDAETA